MVATHEDLLSVSSSFSRIIKRGIGKGPEACFSVLKGNRLYVYIRNFMTPGEELLANKDEITLIYKYRSSILSSLENEFKEEASYYLGISFHTFHQDWNVFTNTGIFMLENSDSNPDVKMDENTRNNLFHTARVIGSQLHKFPCKMDIVTYSQSLCTLEIKEVLLPIEHLLLEQGKMDLLLTYEMEIKKGYYKQIKLFEEVFNREITELFTLLDEKLNKYYLIFQFKKVEGE